jgi:ubiquinone biosynthesis protein Coq4
MHPLTWTQAETSAVIGAFKYVCSDGGTKALLPAHDEFLEGFRDHIFHHSELDLATVAPVPSAAFAERITDPEHRVHALEYLTLAPYIEPEMRPEQADLVAGYFAALRMRSDAFTFMKNIANRHILIGQLCIARKLLPLLLPGGPITHLVRAVRMLRESRGNAKVAAEYHALEKLPKGTLGNAFYRFHRLRGFQLPGEKGCIPEELSALHDLMHILSGYNTDFRGEILAQAFAGGTMPKYGMMAAVSGLLSFHNGLLFDARGRYKLERGNLDPRAWAHAFERGMNAIHFLDHWDFKADWRTPVAEVRERFNITNAVDVWDIPPPPERVPA